MANKSKMKCNVVRPSTRPGKKKMVKACEGGKEKLIQKRVKAEKKSLYTLEQKDMDIIIHLLRERASRHVTSVERQKAN